MPPEAVNTMLPEGSAHSRSAAGAAGASDSTANGNQSTTAAVQGSAPAATSALPKELEGKSPAEIAAYYADRYKDYDTLKTRAEQYEAYEKIGLKPEDIATTTRWVQDLLTNLQRGQRAYLDPQNNRIVFVDDKGQTTSAPAGQQQQPATDSFADWEILAPAQQAERLAAHVWDQRLTPKIAEVVQHYDQMFNQALANLQARENILLEVLDRWMANPKLNPRELMQKAIELGSNVQRNPIDLAAQQLLTPAEIQAKAEELAAQRFAEMQRKWEEEHKAPILDAPAAFTPRAVLDGRPLTRGEVKRGLIQRFRQDGILRGPVS